MTHDIAFLYDFLQVPGGAEQLALHIHKQFEEIDFTFGFIDRVSFSEEKFNSDRIQALTSASQISGWLGIKAMRAFQRKATFLRNYQIVMYSGVYAPVAIEHHPIGRNIYYCHTPPRYVYDLRDFYLQHANPFKKILLNSLIKYIQPRYEKAIHQMDTVVANSLNVRNRLQKYLAVSDVTVIYPPVNTREFSWAGQGDYYLSTARLEPYKRVELLVRAFMQMPRKKLIVASGGSDLRRLQKLAAGNENIVFAGWCTSSELRELIGNCIATIYIPPDEDFGMSPVESMAAGKPVIGVAQGGLLESVLHGETGLLIDPHDLNPSTWSSPGDGINTIVEAINNMDGKTALNMRLACEERAALFDSKVFDKKIEALIYK